MPNETRVLIGVPVPPNYMADARIVAQLEMWNTLDGVETYYPSTRAAESGQDKIVQFALYGKPRATHILFVDYDVLPRPNTLKRLLLHGKDIVSGVYPLIIDSEISWCCSKEDPFIPMPYLDLPTNPFKAKTISNGMMLVKTSVFDKLEWPYWEVGKRQGRGDVLSADIYFFQKAREAGYDLWVDPKVKCEHFKTVGLLGIARKYIMKGNKQ